MPRPKTGPHSKSTMAKYRVILPTTKNHNLERYLDNYYADLLESRRRIDDFGRVAKFVES